MTPRADVLLVSLGGTAGLRAADAILAGQLRAAGARIAVSAAEPPREVRTLALTDLAWALAARRAARRGTAEHRPKAVLYSSVTAALLAPAPGAVRFDAPAHGNRPGRHGAWQRPRERRVLRAAPLLVPWSGEALAEAPSPHAPAVVVPVPVEPSGAIDGPRDIAAVAYGANPAKKGLDHVLEAWRRVRREGEELVVAGLDGSPEDGIRYAGMVSASAYRALLRRTRIFVAAPRREDHGLAQLEALADGCVLVTTPAPGPYVALPIARDLDARLATPELGPAIRAALDDPRPGYAARAAERLAPLSAEAVQRRVTEALLPALLGDTRWRAP